MGLFGGGNKKTKVTNTSATTTTSRPVNQQSNAAPAIAGDGNVMKIVTDVTSAGRDLIRTESKIKGDVTYIVNGQPPPAVVAPAAVPTDTTAAMGAITESVVAAYNDAGAAQLNASIQAAQASSTRVGDAVALAAEAASAPGEAADKPATPWGKWALWAGVGVGALAILRA